MLQAVHLNGAQVCESAFTKAVLEGEWRNSTLTAQEQVRIFFPRNVFQVHDFNDDLNVKPIKALERMHQSGTRSQLKYLRTLQADVTELLRVCTVEPKSLKELAFRKTRITKVPRPSTTPKPQSVSSASSSREKSLEKAFSLTSEESSGMLIDQIR